MAVSDKWAIWPTGPRCDTHGRRQGLAGQRVDAQSTHQRPSAAGVEGAGGSGGPGCGARGRRQGLVGLRDDAPSHTPAHQASLVWRAVAGPGRGAGGWRQGQGGPRDRPLRAFRLACGDLAGGPPPTGTPSDLALRRPEHPWGHTATQQHKTSPRHNKTARPQWGRAAVAVALGFEPRVAVTPHSISSAAPSAARTRYLTRILYYTLPPSAQIDRAGWEQGHTAVRKQGHTADRKQSHTAVRKQSHTTTQNQGHTTPRDHTAAHETGTTCPFRTVENEIK